MTESPGHGSTLSRSDEISPGPSPLPPHVVRWVPDASNDLISLEPEFATTILPSDSLLAPTAQWSR